MLCGIQPASGIERDTNRVANAGRITLRWRETLIGLACVVLPDSGTRLELGTVLYSGGIQRAVFDLTGIACRSDVYENVTAGIDDEWMHRVISIRGQAIDDHFRGGRWGHAV